MIPNIPSMELHATNLENLETITEVSFQVILFLSILKTQLSTVCGWAKHSQLCNKIKTILIIDSFKHNIGHQAKGKKLLDLERYEGAWDGKWECVMASTTIMWTKYSFLVKTQKDDSIVQI